jgi:hypothetical protein
VSRQRRRHDDEADETAFHLGSSIFQSEEQLRVEAPKEVEITPPSLIELD